MCLPHNAYQNPKCHPYITVCNFTSKIADLTSLLNKRTCLHAFYFFPFKNVFMTFIHMILYSWTQGKPIFVVFFKNVYIKIESSDWMFFVLYFFHLSCTSFSSFHSLLHHKIPLSSLFFFLIKG